MNREFESALSLDLPDWSGQVDFPPTATVDDMHRPSKSFLPCITARPGFDENRQKEMISEEFFCKTARPEAMSALTVVER